MSKKGFGAVILQEEQPIYYASRALTSAEKNYQNLEREAQAAVWGMEKFHYFLYGRKFILQTDRKPLVSIFRKHMIDVSPRIQRITIHAWQYEFEPQYIPGRNNVILKGYLSTPVGVPRICRIFLKFAYVDMGKCLLTSCERVIQKKTLIPLFWHSPVGCFITTINN